MNLDNGLNLFLICGMIVLIAIVARVVIELAAKRFSGALTWFVAGDRVGYRLLLWRSGARVFVLLRGLLRPDHFTECCVERASSSQPDSMLHEFPFIHHPWRG